MHNRPISRDNINKYAIQMSEGKWHLNGEAIIINDKGLTDNGYHRLAACIQAGVPFQTVRGQDKQKVVTDLWNKYISSKENIRVNITSAIIFK